MAVLLIAILAMCSLASCTDTGDEPYKGFLVDSTTHIFHTYKLKNGMIRRFCETPASWENDRSYHAIGYAEQDNDTIHLLGCGEECHLTPYNECRPFWKLISDDGRYIYITILDEKSYYLYRIDCESLEVRNLAQDYCVIALRATDSTFVISDCRIINEEEATCCALLRYLYHDVTIGTAGDVICNDSTHEYDMEQLQDRFECDSNNINPIAGFQPL